MAGSRISKLKGSPVTQGHELVTPSFVYASPFNNGGLFKQHSYFGPDSCIGFIRFVLGQELCGKLISNPEFYS